MNRVTRSGEVYQNGSRIGRVTKVQGNKWVAEKRFEGGDLGVAFVQVGDKFTRQSDAVIALIRADRKPYIPGTTRIGEPTPQTHPHLFTDDEIRAEIKYLARLDRKYGSHILRAQARIDLYLVLAERDRKAGLSS